MKKAEFVRKTETYEAGYENFLIDIVEKTAEVGQNLETIEKKDVVEAYLYREDMSTKKLMFGVKGRNTPEFQQSLMNSLELYVQQYDDEVY